MDLSPSPTVAEWRAFLQPHSEEFLESHLLRVVLVENDAAHLIVSETQRENRWLGYEPASEETVAALEERLGVKLPPSYRNFLLTSNGWSELAYAMELWNAEDVGWFADVYPELIEIWSLGGTDDWAELAERSLIFGDDNGGAGNYWLLDSGNIAENGEWTAYDWWPGDGVDPEPYDSFAALVSGVRNSKAEQDRRMAAEHNPG